MIYLILKLNKIKLTFFHGLTQQFMCFIFSCCNDSWSLLVWKQNEISNEIYATYLIFSHKMLPGKYLKFWANTFVEILTSLNPLIVKTSVDKFFIILCIAFKVWSWNFAWKYTWTNILKAEIIYWTNIGRELHKYIGPSETLKINCVY